MVRTTDPANPILYECRRFIHDDRDAEETAGAISARGVPVESMHQYLKARWDPIPDWDDTEFIQVLKAVVNPTASKVAGVEAARIAYDQLDDAEKNLLKFKVDGLSEEVMAQALQKSVKQVKSDANTAKKTFWQLFTRARWSTLPYFLEGLCEEVDSPDMLKVEAEYRMAETAYNALEQRAKDVLKLRHLEGCSVSEIAAKQGSPIEAVSRILTEAREDFCDAFLSELYSQYIMGQCIVETDESGTPKIESVRTSKIEIGSDGDGEDHTSDAWLRLHKTFYKLVPNNFRSWATTTAKGLKRDSEDKQRRHDRRIKQYGHLDMNLEGEHVYVLGSAAVLQPDEALEKEALEKEELRSLARERRRWHALLTETAEAILGTKKAEKKLYILVNYILQPKLDELSGAKVGVPHESQMPGEAMTIAHFKHYQSKATQAKIGEVIDATDRSIRRYLDEILPLVKRYAKAVGIADAELVEGCAPIKASDVKEKQG